MVFLEQKMFRKVDKHKRNDQNEIIHPFGKPTKKTERYGFPSTKNSLRLSESIQKYDSRKVYIDSWKVYIEEQNDPQLILHLFGIFFVKYTYKSCKNPKANRK